MRHNASGRKLGRKTGHRLALFRNQLASLVAQERIVTTVAKAKELRPIAERVVTQGRLDTVHARRLVGRWIPNRDLVKKLFDEIAPRFAGRPGGYLRIVKLGRRQGDNAELAVLEFVDFERKAKAAPPPPEAKAGKGKKGERVAPDAEATAAVESAEKPAAKAAKPPRGTKAKAAKPGAKARPNRAPATGKRTSTPKKIGGS
jgi:large subunit ribosomal protein L17